MKYYNKYVLNDHTELSYLSGSISSKNLSPSLPGIYNNRERFICKTINAINCTD